MKIKFKEWFSTIPPKLSKRTFTSHLNTLNINNNNTAIYDVESRSCNVVDNIDINKR